MTETLYFYLSLALPFLLTCFGASLIFCFRKPSKLFNVLTVAFASGIMISASIWSLLVPALEDAQKTSTIHPILPVGLGFAVGALLMFFLDILCNKLENNKKITKNNKKTHRKMTLLKKNTKNDTIITSDINKSNINKKNFQNNSLHIERQRATKLFAAITFHNIPEGLAVGFALGNAISSEISLLAAFMFALGIAIQNFPEGLATALPMHNCLHNKRKAFFWGAMSGIVEPAFAIIGYFLATHLTFLLPWMLSISAGAMIFVTIKDLMPEIYTEKCESLATWTFILGFFLMMTLDICL